MATRRRTLKLTPSRSLKRRQTVEAIRRTLLLLFKRSRSLSLKLRRILTLGWRCRRRRRRLRDPERHDALSGIIPKVQVWPSLS